MEQQLRTAYGSLGRAALRASGGPAPDGLSGSVRVSRIGLAATQAPVAQSLDETIEVGLRPCFAGLASRCVTHHATTENWTATCEPAHAQLLPSKKVVLQHAVNAAGWPLSPPLQALAPHENLIEVHISEVTLSAAAELAPDASTFVAWDFFLHDSQATPVLPGHNPCFNTTGDTMVQRAVWQHGTSQPGSTPWIHTQNSLR